MDEEVHQSLLARLQKQEYDIAKLFRTDQNSGD
jgi:hypothetical protein